MRRYVFIILLFISTAYGNTPKVFDIRFSSQAIDFIKKTTTLNRKLIGVAKLNLHYFGIAGEIEKGKVTISRILKHTIGYDHKTVKIYNHWVKVFEIRDHNGALVIRAAYRSAGDHMLDIECIAYGNNWSKECSAYDGRILL